MKAFQFQNSPSSLLSFLIMIILFAITAASYTSNGATKTNEQYLITGKITDRKLIRGTNCPPAVGWTNENGTMTRLVYIPESFEKIDLIDYQAYRIEDRLVGERTFFSTNVPMTSIALIVTRTDDTKPDLKPCIVFAEPYSLPDDVIQNNNLQGARILHVEAIFKEGPRYDSLLRQYGIKPEVILEARVTLKPEALEVSPGTLTAFVRLPEGYPVTNITSATCDGAPSERMMLSDDKTEMIIKFRRKDIEAALAQTGESIDTHFVVRGIWQGATGTSVPFQGTASITKIVGAEKEKKK